VVIKTDGRVKQLGWASLRVAALIRDAREARDMTLERLSREMGARGHPMGQSTLSNIETGQRRINVDDLVALADVFEMLPADLMPGRSRDTFPLHAEISPGSYADIVRIRSLPEDQQESLELSTQAELREEADRAKMAALQKRVDAIERRLNG
jgi:transcriptional regulator with XRE-family HTH domain